MAMCESLMLVRRAGTLVKGAGDAVILAEQENRAQWGSRSRPTTDGCSSAASNTAEKCF